MDAWHVKASAHDLDAHECDSELTADDSDASAKDSGASAKDSDRPASLNVSGYSLPKSTV